MKRLIILYVILVSATLGGCENIPLKEGGLAVGKNTTVSIEDVGVASVKNEF